MTEAASMSKPILAVNIAQPWSRDRRAPSPGLILIGASTGGPQAIVLLLNGLAPVISRVPICVTLHMPPDMMHLIASHVARTCGIETKVVTKPGQLELGRVHFAPGDQCFSFKRGPSSVDIDLIPSPPGHFCRHAIDAMFLSAAASYHARTLGIVLTGMGTDGLDGARAIVEVGGTVLVQDKASSSVWGMPGAVAKANLATATLNLQGIANHVVDRLDLPMKST